MSYYRQPPSRVYGTGAGIGLPPVTPVVKSIMIACTGIWVVQLAVWHLNPFWDPSGLLGVVPARVVQGWLWQPLTYMFLHSTGNISHLLMNMLVLYMVGGDLERYWGPRRFLKYYLVCGAGAALFITVAGFVTETPNTPTIGASGAIYGLLLAFGTVFAERVFLFMFLFPMRARTFCWILFAVQFISLWEPGGGVSHIAHLGGGVVGYLYLKRVWKIADFYRELRWRFRKRKFRVMPPRDEDRYIH